MLRRLRGKGPKKRGGDSGKLEGALAGNTEYVTPEPGPCRPTFPLPPTPVLAILRPSVDETADFTPQQLKYVAKEWLRLENQRSVCFSVESIEDAVLNANGSWDRLPTASADGSVRPRKQAFAIGVKRTRGEILDEMYKNPAGVLCRATHGLPPKTPDGFGFSPGDLVLLLRTARNTGTEAMFDGIAHGLRGEFSSTLVERDPDQPTDMTFMWLNQKRPSLVDAAIAATFDHAATAVNDGDDYLNINEDEAEDDDDAADVLAEAQALGYGAAGSGSAADDAWAETDHQTDDAYLTLGGGGGGNAVDIELMLYGDSSGGDGDASSSDDGAEGPEGAEWAEGAEGAAPVVLLDTQETAEVPAIKQQPNNTTFEEVKWATAPVDSEAAVPKHLSHRPGPIALTDLDGQSPAELIELGSASPGTSPGAISIHSATSGEEERFGRQFSNRTSNANEGPWGKAIMSPPPMRRAGSMDGKIQLKKKEDGDSGGKTGWLGRPTRRSKRSATLTGSSSITTPSVMPANTNSELVKAAVSAQIWTLGGTGKPGKAGAKSKDLQTMGMQTNFWRRSFLLRSSKEPAKGENENPYTERAFIFIKNCIEAMHELGVDEAGIYRIAGVKSKITRLHDTFCVDTKPVEFHTYDIPTLSSAVKYFFREAKMPLLTPYASWLYAVTSTSAGSDERTAELRKCLQKLPWPNQAMLTLLMDHLQLVENQSNLNKMTASNIGVVFGPTLLRPVDDRDQVDVLADIPHCAQVVASLISLVSRIDEDEAAGDGLVSEPEDAGTEERDARRADLDSRGTAPPPPVRAGHGAAVGDVAFGENPTESESEDDAGDGGRSGFVAGQGRGSFSSFGSGFGDYNTEEEPEEDAVGGKHARAIEAGHTPSFKGNRGTRGDQSTDGGAAAGLAARRAGSGRRGKGISRNRPTSVYGFDGMLAPEFLSPESQAPAGIAEDEESAPSPSPTAKSPPAARLPALGPDKPAMEPDNESSSDSDADDDDADKGYIKISFPRKAGTAAAASTGKVDGAPAAAGRVAAPDARSSSRSEIPCMHEIAGTAGKGTAFDRSARAASVYGFAGMGQDEDEDDTDGELPNDPDSDESMGC